MSTSTSSAGGGEAGGGGTADGGAGGSTGGSIVGGSGGGLPCAEVPATLQSNAIEDDGSFPIDYTCQGADMSPPLDWLPGGCDAQSWAIVLADETRDHFLHWVIWDMPVAVLALPGNVSKVENPPMPSGAKQALSFDGVTHGYLGPCPTDGEHLYRFRLHALDVPLLPDVTTASSMAEVEAVLLAHTQQSATLDASAAP